MHFTASQLVPGGSITMMAVDGFTPNFGGEGKFLWRFLVPTSALSNVGNPSFDFYGQRAASSLFHRIMNVTVGVIPEQTPDGTIWSNGHSTALACFVQ